MKKWALRLLLGAAKHTDAYTSAINQLKNVNSSVDIGIDAANVVLAAAGKKMLELQALNKKINEVLKNA